MCGDAVSGIRIQSETALCRIKVGPVVHETSVARARLAISRSIVAGHTRSFCRDWRHGGGAIGQDDLAFGVVDGDQKGARRHDALSKIERAPRCFALFRFRRLHCSSHYLASLMTLIEYRHVGCGK